MVIRERICAVNSIIFIFSVFVLIPQVASATTSAFTSEVLFCPGKAGELLDLYEARILQNNPVDMENSGDDYREKVLFLLKRIGKTFPEQEVIYRQWLSSFENEAAFIPSRFASEGARAEIPIPRGCEVERAHSQVLPVYSGDKRYMISLYVWDRIDEDTRAVLVFRILLLRDAQKNGQKDGRRVKYLVSLIAGQSYSKVRNLREWADHLRWSRFDHFKHMGIFDLTRSGFSKEGKLEFGAVSKFFEYPVLVNGKTFLGNSLPQHIKASLINEELLRVPLCDERIFCGSSFPVRGKIQGPIEAYGVRFEDVKGFTVFSDGRIKEIYKDTVGQMLVYGRVYEQVRSIRFRQNGSIEHIWLKIGSAVRVGHRDFPSV